MVVVVVQDCNHSIIYFTLITQSAAVLIIVIMELKIKDRDMLNDLCSVTLIGTMLCVIVV